MIRISPLRLSSKYCVIFLQGLSLDEADILKLHNIIICTLPLHQVFWEPAHSALRICGYIGFMFKFSFKNPCSGGFSSKLRRLTMSPVSSLGPATSSLMQACVTWIHCPKHSSRVLKVLDKNNLCFDFYCEFQVWFRIIEIKCLSLLHVFLFTFE